MCNCNSTTISPLAQLFPALELNGGAWTVHTVGQTPGDYLAMAPGEAAHVVMVSEDCTRRRVFACTCDATLFDQPTADVAAGCVHIGLVSLFLALVPQELAASLGSLVRRIIAGRARGWDAARLAALEARTTLLQSFYTQRTAAGVYRTLAAAPAQPEAAPAASLWRQAGVWDAVTVCWTLCKYMRMASDCISVICSSAWRLLRGELGTVVIAGTASAKVNSTLM